MPTSFTRTRNQIADLVLGKLGILAAGGSAASADQDLVYEAIDLRLKEIHRLGIFWRNVAKQSLSFTIPANIASASSTADVLFPIAMFAVDGSNDQTVDIIDIRGYAGIENKTETGVPQKALYAGSAEFIFWPVPTAATTAKLVYESIAEDTSASAGTDVDVSMIRWLRDIIAFDLGDHYGKSEQKMARWEKASEKAERNIRRLAVQRVDYAPVVIEDFRQVGSTETDYGR